MSLHIFKQIMPIMFEEKIKKNWDYNYQITWKYFWMKSNIQAYNFNTATENKR